MEPIRVLESCVYVDDLDEAHAFYTQIIGLSLFSREPGRHLFFHCGSSMFLVFDPGVTSKPSGIVPTHGAHGPGHVAFAIQRSNLEAWRQHLADHNVPIEKEVAWPSGGHSIYFRDPSGNSVELATPQTWSLPEHP